MTRQTQNPDFVLEFVVNYVTCRNFNAMACPLSITIPGCPPIDFTPKKTSMTKLTYEKGKRLIFQHERLLDLKAIFELRAGHGNSAVRGKCSFDFFEIGEKITESNPTVYLIDVTMSRPDNSRFGVLNCEFQIFPYREYEEIKQTNGSTSARAVAPQYSTSNRMNSNAIQGSAANKSRKAIVRPIQSARGGPSKRSGAPFRSYQSQKGNRIDDEFANKNNPKTPSNQNSIHQKQNRTKTVEQLS